MTEDPLDQPVLPDSGSGSHHVVLRGSLDLVAASSLVGRGLARVVRGEWHEEKVAGLPYPVFSDLIVSPVGNQLASNMSYPDRHELSLYERGIGSWVLTRRLRFSKPPQNPDERRTGSPSHARRLKSLSQTQSSIAEDHDGWSCAAWSPCGRYLAIVSMCGTEFVDEDNRLLVFDTATGGCRQVAFIHVDLTHMVTWSRSGAFLALASSGRTPILRLWRCHWQQGSLGRELLGTELIGGWNGPPGMRTGFDLQDAHVRRDEELELVAKELWCYGASGVAFSNDERALTVVLDVFHGAATRGLVVLLSVPQLEETARRPLAAEVHHDLSLRRAPSDERLLAAGLRGVEVLDARLQSGVEIFDLGDSGPEGTHGFSRAAWSGTGEYVCIGTYENWRRWKSRTPGEPHDLWDGVMLVISMADHRVLDGRIVAGGVLDMVWAPSRRAFMATTGSATVVEWRPPLGWCQ